MDGQSQGTENKEEAKMEVGDTKPEAAAAPVTDENAKPEEKKEQVGAGGSSLHPSVLLSVMDPDPEPLFRIQQKKESI